jgi:hypothetical protein
MFHFSGTFKLLVKRRLKITCRISVVELLSKAKVKEASKPAKLALKTCRALSIN